MKCFLLASAMLAVFVMVRAEDEAPTSSVVAAEPTPAIVDHLIIGDAASEESHALQADTSERFQGGLDQPALRLLPGGDVTWESAPMTFTMKVDPNEQNYFTIKLWGSDKGEDCGRLILFADGLQVGYRHEGDYDVLNQTDAEAEAPGRFIYETVLLPKKLTSGKTSISLKIVALGAFWPYAKTWARYQKDFTAKTRGIYGVYTHTGGYFVPPADEKQGATPPAGVRPTPGEEVMESTRKSVVDTLTNILSAPTLKAHSNPAQMLRFMAQAYQTRWTAASRNPRAIDQIILDGDALTADLMANPGKFGWTGAGPLGEAIVKTWPAIGKQLDDSQKEAWTTFLRASIDFERTHRRAYTNQSMIVDYNIYTANRALELMSPQQALPESQALGYLYQAVGIDPWLGSDLPGGDSEKPYGSHYYLITRKGLSRELGYVGTYGETILRFAHDMAVFTGDEKIRRQLGKIEDARLNFRYPGTDADGYRCMKLVSEIDNRTSHYPLSGAAYNASNIREEWGMDVPALLSDDPEAVGAAQQSLADNQYFARVASRLDDPDTLGMMLNLDDYATVKAFPPISWRMPMTDGQPDFVFSDEEDAILALKHDGTRLFINFYYRAEEGVNRVARILELTPNLTRMASVRTQVEMNDSGQTFVRPDWIDWTRTRGFVPPGQDLHQAWAGENLPISKRPGDASLPPYGKGGPLVGKAAFYWLRYGDYLIGLNTTEDQSYTLPVPSDRDHATDLVSGKVINFAGGVKVPARTTVVLYLGTKL